VEQGQDLGFSQLHAKTNARTIHQTLHDFFQQAGYKTTCSDARMRGFCHAAGYGLGLELHETPTLSPHSKDSLAVGHVLTLKPGLYYPEIGGVRLKDVALVTRNGPRNLTKFEKILEI
jgi:Xaa-Pro aminopeptidase